MATFYEGIDLRECRFPVKPTGDVKWAYTSLYRTFERPNHNGVDIGSSHYPHYETCYGWPLLALADGDVFYKYDGTSGHNANLSTPFGTFCYCHMQPPSNTGQQNRSVKVGDIIGHIGTSGNVPAHVHFIWFQGGKDRNPVPLLDAISLAQWDTHTPLPDTPTNPSDPNHPDTLRSMIMAGAIFSVDGGPQVFIDGKNLGVVLDEGDRSLRHLTLANPMHPLAGGDWVELSSSNPSHAAACKAYYDHYADQLTK